MSPGGHMLMSIFVNYISEHQLPHALNTSHTTPITHINWDPILLKFTDEDIIYVLNESHHTWDYSPSPSPKLGPTTRYSITITV